MFPYLVRITQLAAVVAVLVLVKTVQQVVLVAGVHIKQQDWAGLEFLGRVMLAEQV
jgi:hypothetical protein